MRLPSLQTGALAVVSGLFLTLPDRALAQSPAVPAVVYFSQDWCPLSSQRQALEAHFRLTMSGCCIFKAEYTNADPMGAASTLAAVESHVRRDQDLGVCTASNAELDLERRAEQQAQEAARLQQANVERRDLRSKLRSVELPLLCMRAGELARDEFTLPEAPAMGAAALPFVREELIRRGTSFDLERVKKKSTQVGDTECHLFAAWGLPIRSNYTSTGARNSVQHVYGATTYVYAERNRIRAMQGRE